MNIRKQAVIEFLSVVLEISSFVDTPVYKVRVDNPVYKVRVDIPVYKVRVDNPVYKVR